MFEFFKRSAEVKTRKSSMLRRSQFTAASTDRLFESWNKSNREPNSVLETELARLRARSRDMVNNNDFGKQTIRLYKDNVIGDGIKFSSNLKFGNGGGPLVKANDEIETAFKEWSKKGNCTVCGQYSFAELQKAFVATIVRDGECIIRKVWGRDAGNDFGFALELIDVDRLEETHNKARTANENRVKMSVEVNKFNRPVAYWILEDHPQEVYATVSRRKRIRYTAKEIIHGFRPDRAGQIRGIPELHSTLARLKMLGAYEEAELVAARVGASKMGFLTTPDGTYDGEVDANGDHVQELTPGTIDLLPEGYGFEKFDADHPSTAFDGFRKAMLRGVASGAGVSYNALANDLEGVNYSSLREGKLGQQEIWRDWQRFTIETLCDPVLHDWAFVGNLHGVVKDQKKLCESCIWQARGWQWVDPAKEITAFEKAVALGIKSRTQILREQGVDFAVVIAELENEKMMIEKAGLQPEPAKPEKESGNASPKKS